MGLNLPFRNNILSKRTIIHLVRATWKALTERKDLQVIGPREFGSKKCQRDFIDAAGFPVSRMKMQERNENTVNQTCCQCECDGGNPALFGRGCQLQHRCRGDGWQDLDGENREYGCM